MGNLVFRKTSRNFNPLCAMAGKITIVEVEELVPVGSIDPDQVQLGGWTALFLAVPSLGTSLLGFGAGGAALTATMCFFAGANEIEAVTSGMGTVATLDDQIGWNWAKKPKKISENAFNDLAKRIESGTHLVDFANQVFGTGARDRRLEHRIARDKEKLQSKNVRFPENTWGFEN